jgi:transposase-like protein
MQQRWREMYVKWRGLISEQSGSGQTIAAFCRDRGLTASQFFAWKKRLRQATGEQFVEVQVRRTPEQPSKGNRGAIEIHLAEGRRILVEPGFDAEHLRAVVAALETRG